MLNKGRVSLRSLVGIGSKRQVVGLEENLFQLVAEGQLEQSNCNITNLY